MSEFALKIQSLEKTYGRFSLGPIDLSIPKGAIYGLIGPNGAGKTTLIDLILGIARSDNGRIEVLGRNLADHEVEIKKRAGYVSPEMNFQAWRRVGNLLRFHEKVFSTWDGAYCNRLLMALDVHPDEKILNLSFGARIKLALILALARHPEVLLLDEPTVGLDVLSRQQTLAECAAAAEDHGCTVLLSSHGLTDIERIATHVGFLRKGRLIFDGPISGILARFRRVEFRASNGGDFASIRGTHVHSQEGSRWAMLLDMESDALQRIKAQGGTDIRAEPIELEDVFVSMMLER